MGPAATGIIMTKLTFRERTQSGFISQTMRYLSSDINGCWIVSFSESREWLSKEWPEGSIHNIPAMFQEPKRTQWNKVW